MNFWQELKKPITGLSPMDGMTDVAFRYALASTYKPSVIFTEFVNADGLIKGGIQVFRPLFYNQIERPVVAQLFGKDPEMFRLSAMLIAELGFDGVDINMGCPSKTVARRGAGAGLINTPELAKEIIFATKQGVDDWVCNGTKNLPDKINKKILTVKNKLKEMGVRFPSNREPIPVSLKTRIGYAQNTVKDWIPQLMEAHPSCISLHGRTFKQLYSGKADWEAIKEAAQIIKKLSSKGCPTVILGNGDIKSAKEIPSYVEKYNVDGVLVGRATLGNPWFFKGIDSVTQKSYKEIKSKLIEHLTAYDKVFGDKGFVSQRKHMAWYIKGFPNASELRVKLMQTNNVNEVIKILDEQS